MPLLSRRTIKTVVVCYTQAAFDDTPPDDPDDEPLTLQMARQVRETARALVAALQAAGIEAEEVRVPLRGFTGLDYSRAALQWRLLGLTQSNDRSIDAVVCLDFPAWSVGHPRKICWVREMPNFVYRRKMSNNASLQSSGKRSPQTNTVFNADPEEPSVLASLAQAEQKGLVEATVYAAERDIAESLARTGLKVQYLPLPAADLAPAAPEWKGAVARLLT